MKGVCLSYGKAYIVLENFLYTLETAIESRILNHENKLKITNMYSADVIKKLYKELQQCRRQNEKLKEKVKVLESKLEKRENECKNLIEMIELILGNEI